MMEISVQNLDIFAKYIKDKKIDRSFYPERKGRRGLAYNDKFYTKLVECVKKHNFIQNNITSDEALWVIHNKIYSSINQPHTFSHLEKFILSYQDDVLKDSKGKSYLNIHKFFLILVLKTGIFFEKFFIN